jgi:hypothetical protein
MYAAGSRTVTLPTWLNILIDWLAVVKFKFLTAFNMRNMVLWDVTPCSLIDKGSEGTLAFTINIVLSLRLDHSKGWQSSTNIHGVISCKKVISSSVNERDRF